MADSGKDRTSVNADGSDRAGQQRKGTPSVFEDASKPQPESGNPVRHEGEHGQNGFENDLDRAEEAGREGGRR
jgi:hypothetical protein